MCACLNGNFSFFLQFIRAFIITDNNTHMISGAVFDFCFTAFKLKAESAHQRRHLLFGNTNRKKQKHTHRDTRSRASHYVIFHSWHRAPVFAPNKCIFSSSFSLFPKLRKWSGPDNIYSGSSRSDYDGFMWKKRLCHVTHNWLACEMLVVVVVVQGDELVWELCVFM